MGDTVNMNTCLGFCLLALCALWVVLAVQQPASLTPTTSLPWAWPPAADPRQYPQHPRLGHPLGGMYGHPPQSFEVCGQLGVGSVLGL